MTLARNNRKKIIWKRCLLITAVLLVSGCAAKEPEKQEDKYLIGVVTKSENSEYWMSVCAGMEDAARESNGELIIMSPDAETEKSVQKKMIQDLLKMKIDALAVSPIDSYDNKAYIGEAEEKGIPVYSYDTPIADAPVPYIGIDNEKMGYDLAEVMAKTLGHEGNIAVIAGSMTQASHEERVRGFERYMNDEPDIHIKVMKSGYSNLRVSEREIEEMQKEYPDLDGIMTTSAVTALGIAEATKGTGIAIISVDAQEDALRALKEGEITALGAQDGYMIGYETISYISSHRNSSEAEMEKILEAEILTQDNVDAYLKK